jgi:hypothetical protein
MVSRAAQEVVAWRRRPTLDRAPGRGPHSPRTSSRDAAGGGGRPKLEESDTTAIATTSTAHGESKVGTR